MTPNAHVRDAAFRTVVASVIVAVAITALVQTGVTQAFDASVHRALRSWRADHQLTVLALAAGVGGMRGTLVLSLVLAGALAWRRQWARIAGVAVAFFSMGFVVNVVKPLVGRPRPEAGAVLESGLSFPSGHALATVAFWTYATWCAHAFGPTAFAAVRAVGIVVVLVTGFGRLHLGVHWFTDVVGGYAVGGAIAAAAILMVESATMRRKSRGLTIG